MEFFSALEPILYSGYPASKIELFERFYPQYLDGFYAFDHTHIAKHLEYPSYASFCTISNIRELEKRNNLSLDKNRAILLHAILHIEYSAIDLALDAAYRFKGMPKAYYDDWLVVAEDEIRHFKMLEALLHELGYRYGDFVVHDGLFMAMSKTTDVLSRMAVVPRYLEAGGLDSNPRIIAKLSHFKDPFALKMIAAQRIILEEEIGHVQKGDKWYKWACQKNGINPDIYLDLVAKALPNSTFKRSSINVEARLRAGFSCDEINQLSTSKVCDEQKLPTLKASS